MAMERKQWSEEELSAASKKDIVQFLKENGSNAFHRRHKLGGAVHNIIKVQSKGTLEASYKDLWATYVRANS
jgi:hypothetical protein